MIVAQISHSVQREIGQLNECHAEAMPDLLVGSTRQNRRSVAPYYSPSQGDASTVGGTMLQSRNAGRMKIARSRFRRRACALRNSAGKRREPFLPHAVGRRAAQRSAKSSIPPQSHPPNPSVLHSLPPIAKCGPMPPDTSPAQQFHGEEMRAMQFVIISTRHECTNRRAEVA